MKNDLSSLNMEKGCSYEAILTTENNEGLRNAAPFGVTCLGHDEIMIRMFKGTDTLANIIETKKFIVNITDNSLIFTKSYLNIFDLDELNENNTLKDCYAYFKCEALKEKETTRKDEFDVSDLVIIKAKVVEVVINEKYVKPLNRATARVCDCLIYLSRIDIVDEDRKEHYISRFKKNKKLIKKVGTKKEKESMKLIEEKLNEKGLNLLKK